MDALQIVLGFFAWVGHATIWLVVLNILYSRAIPRRILRTFRLIDAFIVFSFPLVLLGLAWTESVAGPIVLAYLGLCWAITMVAIPTATVRRQCRRVPRALILRKSWVVDYAKELGYKPIGDWKNASWARLPGNQVFQVEFVEIDLAFPDLPPTWDGLTILHLTDLHFCGTPEMAFFERVFDRCRRDDVPDILAVTGDFVDTNEHHKWILPLFQRLAWREFGVAILGNHDTWQQHEAVRDQLRRSGLIVLGNGWCEREVRGHRMIVLGNERPWFSGQPNNSPITGEAFRIGLSHTPDNIRWARRNSIRLLMCGHTHGGQIRLPLFGSLFVPSCYSRHFDAGLFDCSPTLMYVSRGLSGRDPLRYGCRPEVTRYRLRRAEGRS